MKRFVTLLLFNTLFHLFSFGQVQIDAGDNVLLCNFNSYNDSIYLGGNPTLISGEVAKMYWDAKYDVGYRIYSASFFLDDTLSLNPKFINAPSSGDSVYFYLHVEDLSGNVYLDSALVISSMYYCLDEYGTEYINENDTIQIYPFCESPFKPFSYVWSPNYNISDTIVSNPFIWPENDTVYILTITDNLGCSYDIEYEIYVSPASINGTERLNEIEIYPLPGNENTLIKFNSYINSEKLIKLFNLEGKQVGQLQTNDNEIMLSRFNISTGLYICKITVDNELKFSSKIIYAP